MANLMRVGGGGEYYAKVKLIVPEDVTSMQCYLFNEDGSVTEVFDGDRIDAGSILVTSSNTDDVVNQMYVVPEFPEFEVSVVHEDNNVYTLEDYSWEAIVRLAKAGLLSKMFNVGDTKTLTLSDGWSTVATIIGLNHDEKYDGTGTCEATFDFTYIYPATSYMYENSSGYYDVTYWSGSATRTVLIPSIFGMLPDVLQDNIVEVKKLTGYMSKPVIGSTSISAESTAEKLWPFSASELGLSLYTSEGSTTYAYYSDGGSTIKTLADETTAKEYWLRNPVYGFYWNGESITRNWYYVTTAGSYEKTTQNTELSIALGFCL